MTKLNDNIRHSLRFNASFTPQRKERKPNGRQMFEKKSNGATITFAHTIFSSPKNIEIKVRRERTKYTFKIFEIFNNLDF